MNTTSNTQIMDGNAAAAYIAHATNEIIAIYPITPSSTMAELADEKSSQNETNIWGQVPHICEMQSEAGAAGAVHGALLGGTLSTTFTASQGLLLMLPNMHKIAGELTPTVFYVTARTIASHALSIFCDHSDVMSARNTGFAILFASSVQEVMDLALVAQNATLESRIPFILAFDGFRTSHELNKIEIIPKEDIYAFINQEAVLAHKKRRLTPDNPQIKGTAQNPDVFFQAREGINPYYLKAPGVIQENLTKLAKITNRSYLAYEYFGAQDANYIIIAMGSSCETIRETITKLNIQGEKVGLVQVRVFRPFSIKDFVCQLPKTTTKIAVLDRTKEAGSVGEPLLLDVKVAIIDAIEQGFAPFNSLPLIIGGRYGLSSKEFTPQMVKAIFKNLSLPKTQIIRDFTVGINDDITHKSLPLDYDFSSEALDNFCGIFYGMGSDGTVSANKNSIKIIGENSNQFVQGFFEYDSKKSGSYTISHLRFGPNLIRSTYLIERANFIACHNFNFLFKYDVLEKAAPSATLLLASPYPQEQVWNNLPQEIQAQIITKNISVYIVQAEEIARRNQLGARINTIMQTAFFVLTQVIPLDTAIKAIKAAIYKTYAKKGEQIVASNLKAVENTLTAIYQVTTSKGITSQISLNNNTCQQNQPEFIQKVIAPMLKLHGDKLPVSALPVDGSWPSATSKFEKRNIASFVPEWDADLCTQCALCTLVCPHAAIRMKVIDPNDLINAPTHFKHVPAKIKGFENKQYRLQVAVEDCTGCELCVHICPVVDKKEPTHKALNMVSQLEVYEPEKENFAFFSNLKDTTAEEVAGGITNLKGSQLMQPLFEFSGACSGCGETPYIKLLTQLIGDRLIIANATGCSSIFGGNLPTTPYCTNQEGRGPAWANSLFEDNAEFALGLRLANNQLQEVAKSNLLKLQANQEIPNATDLINDILNTKPKTAPELAEQRTRIKSLKTLLTSHPAYQSLVEVLDHIIEKSIWAIGGDGWAYDIGYGGLDHVIASNHKVKILVLDTESYSNTGGQMSKATPLGAIAKFAAQGKTGAKKDLGLLATIYQHVYVAQIALDSNPMQAIRALSEAEAYDGPAIIIAYAQCIAHGINMHAATEQQRKAVQSGYWLLYRYNPSLKLEAKNPLQLDSKAPTIPLAEYLRTETRFSQVKNLDSAKAANFITQAQEQILARYQYYAYLANRPV